MKSPEDIASGSSRLTFIEISNPYEQSADQRALVRSRATKASHRDPDRKAKTSNKDRQNRRRATVSLRKSERESASNSLSSSLTPASFRNADQPRLRSHAARLQTALHSIQPSGGSNEPFGAFPVEAKPWFNWVLDFYTKTHLPLGLQVIQENAAEGQTFLAWHMNLSLSEPSLFYMQLLNALTPLVADGHAKQADAIWVRGRIVASLNEAMNDAQRRLSPAVVYAVGSIALHEFLFGDPDVAVNIHAPAFARMLELRGGVETLELPRIGLKLLEWTEDVISAHRRSMITARLLSAWAPDESIRKHPGYNINTT